MSEETFKFWMPAEMVEKSATGRDGAEHKRWIQGIASTRARDLQGEVVVPEGIDTSYFLNSGYFNFDHAPGMENKVGEPSECKITKDGLWVKGFLYEGKKKSDECWEHFQALKKSGGRRKVGFSIEGKVVRRNGNVIEKCFLMDIAITPSPVNVTTWAEVVKSLSGSKWAAPQSNTLSFDETVALIKREEGVSHETAETLASLIFENVD